MIPSGLPSGLVIRLNRQLSLCPLPPAIKDEFRNARKYGSVRPVSVIVKEQSDADIVMTLISLKHSLK